MARPCGMFPQKTWTNAAGIELPCCVVCGVNMTTIKVQTVCLWRQGFKYTKRFPWREHTCYCDPCREEVGVGSDTYLLVPWDSNASLFRNLISLAKTFASPLQKLALAADASLEDSDD